MQGILPHWVDEDKHGGPSKTSVLRVFGALDTHVHLQVIAIALEIDAVKGLEDRRGDHGIDKEQEAQHREEEGGDRTLSHVLPRSEVQAPYGLDFGL